MVTVLLFLVLATLIVSFCCSLIEAALYSVPIPYARHLEESGSLAGRQLAKLREHMTKPIAAILVVNTLSISVGPTLAGAMVGALYGEGALVAFSLILGAIILLFGEILPKVLGARFCRPVAVFAAIPLAFVVKALSPVIWFTEKISRRMTGGAPDESTARHEVISMAAMGMESGTLDDFEGDVISNVIGLDQLLVRDVLTPRINVFRVEEGSTLRELESGVSEWSFSRVPLYRESDLEQLTGYVMQRDIYRELIRGRRELVVKEIARPLRVVPELMRVDQLLYQMFERREQICAVVDEYGGLAGIVTLEDILEEVVGREIVDESDLTGNSHGEELWHADKVLRFARNRQKKIRALQERKGGTGPLLPA